MEQALAGKSVRFDHEIRCPNGQIRHRHVEYTPHVAQDGTTLGIHVLSGDITERKRVEEKLADMDCNEVLFECGANLAGSLINHRLVDELVIYMAPKLMGHGARSLMNTIALTDMRDAPELEFTDIRNLGGDLRITATLTGH